MISIHIKEIYIYEMAFYMKIIILLNKNVVTIKA